MDIYVVVEYGGYNREAFIGTFMGTFSTQSRAEETAEKLKKEFPDCRYEVGVTRVDNDPMADPIFLKKTKRGRK